MKTNWSDMGSTWVITVCVEDDNCYVEAMGCLSKDDFVSLLLPTGVIDAENQPVCM